MLSNIWFGMLLIAVITAAWRCLNGDLSVLPAMSNALFESAKSAFELSLGVAGNLMLWMGLLAIAERSGAVAQLGRALAPVLRCLFPGLAADSAASGAIVLNFAANALGLDNAATPAGLRAMKALQQLNPDPDRASDHQIMFMVLHAASLTLFPISIIALRSAAGASQPADVFLPILLVSACSALAGFLAVLVAQRRRLSAYQWLALLGLLLAFSLLALAAAQTPAEQLQLRSSQFAAVMLLSTIVYFIGRAQWQRLDSWEIFIEGATEGLRTAWQIAPYLVGMLVMIGLFRSSGALESLMTALAPVVTALGLPNDTVQALPTLLMKPFSGSAARGMMAEVMHTQGADRYAARLAALFQGGTDTTFYVLALYSGAAGLKNLRHTVACALIADLAGALAAVAVGTLLFR